MNSLSYPIESLQRRVLLSATASVVNGVLTVVGTSAGETIVVEYNAATNNLDVRVGATTILSQSTLTVTGIRVEAGAGNDAVTIGTKKNATVLAGDGDDTVLTGRGNDNVDGGAGDDRIELGNGADYGYGGDSGNDRIFGAGGNDQLDGGTGNDTLDAGSGDDTLAGGEGDDRMLGLGGNDYLAPGLGQGYFDGGTGSNTLSYKNLIGTSGPSDNSLPVRVTLDGVANDGFASNPTAFARDFDTLIGGLSDDLLIGNDNDNLILGGEGDDTLTGLSGRDSIDGEDGNDLIEGSRGDDSLVGNNGSDTVLGGAGNDTLTSNGLLYGESDISTTNDLLLGGDGNDRLVASSRATLQGGRGDDFLTFNNQLGTDLVYDLSGGAGNDTFKPEGTNTTGNAAYDVLTITRDDVANDRLYSTLATSNVRSDIETVLQA